MACGAQIPPPPGYKFMRDPVPRPVELWAISLRDRINSFPIHSMFELDYAGEKIVARSDWHTWTYVNGQLRNGICIRGISIFRPKTSVGAGAPVDPPDQYGPDPTLAIYPEPLQEDNTQSIILSGLAAAGVVAMFLIAIRYAGKR